MTAELRRLVGLAGPLVWLMVGAPVLVRGSPEPWRIGWWLLAYAAFAAGLGLALRFRTPALLAAQVAAVIALVLIMCDGFEGALLVLVALQLGGRVPRRAGIAVVAAQSAALGAAIAVHWNLQAALLLVPPYLGFQLLAFFAAEGLTRLEKARAVEAENGRLEERLRISRELHDRLGHHLTALNLNLEVAARAQDRQALQTARELGKSLLQAVRETAAELREPERLDLCGALRTLAEDMPGLHVHVDAPAALHLRDPLPALALLRCAQEALTNAVAHAGAHNVWIELRQHDGALALCARDDGRGAAEVRAGGGLRGMRERLESLGGTLQIDSAAGSGFSLRATLPLRSAP